MNSAFPLMTGATLMLLVSACGSGAQGDKWPEAGVRDNPADLSKTAIGDCCYRGGVTSIQFGDFDSTGDDVLAVLGQTGLVLFEVSELTPTHSFEFENDEGDTIWFGLSPYLLAHESGFHIAMLGGGYGEVGLLDGRGETLWQFRPNADLPPKGMVVDDQPAREARFYVLDHDGLYRLDAQGNVEWQVDEQADYLALVGGDEVALATASHGSRALKLWAADGRSAGELVLPQKPDGLVFVEQGESAGFVVKSGQEIAYLDRSGSHLFTYRYDEAPVRHGPRAALVAMQSGEPPQLALRLSSASSAGMSVLTLLSLDGTRLYEEYLADGPAIGVFPGHQGRGERLLVGETGQPVWLYELP